MRKVIVFNMVSVDDYFAGVDGNIDWHKVDDEFNQFAMEQMQELGGLIFGHTTYKLFEQYWPQALKDPQTSPDDRKIAQMIDDFWKIVFAKDRVDFPWKNTKHYSQISEEEVKSWKQAEGKDIAIFGSGTIVQQFANLNLIDEYRLMVNPVILGEGKPLFDHVKQTDLKLINTRQFKNGNLLLYYQPSMSS